MADGQRQNVFSLSDVKADNLHIYVQDPPIRIGPDGRETSSPREATANEESNYAKLESDGRPVWETPGNVATSAEGRDCNNERTENRKESFKTAPGWVMLSETIYMYRANALKRRAMVYRGKKKFLSEWHDVAIKLIPCDETSIKEVEFLSKLGPHPNVIIIYDAAEYHQHITSYIYIVMEYCPLTLKDYIDGCKGKDFDFVKIWSYAKQLVEGVAYIHSHNVLHRDIKLENILLTKAGEYIRVADFGLSKTIKDDQSVAAISSLGLGSEGFRAPEMLRESPEASFYSDAYSIGIVLGLLFSNGHHPFGSDPNRWRTNIIDHKGLDLSHIAVFGDPHADKKTEFMSLITQILKHNPRDRPTPKDMLSHPFFQSRGGQSKNYHEASDIEKTHDMLIEFQQLNGKDLDTSLKLAECELHLKRGTEDAALRNIRENFSSSDLTAASEVWRKADENYRRGNYTAALLLFKISSDLQIKGKDLSEISKIKAVADRVANMKCAVDSLIKEGGKSSDLANTYGLKYMNEMANSLRSINVTPETRVLTEASCFSDITSVLNQLGLYQNTILIGDEIVERLKTECGEFVTSHKHYGWLLNNIGNAYTKLEKYRKAEDYYSAAMEANDKAQDYDDNNKRQQRIKITMEI